MKKSSIFEPQIEKHYACKRKTYSVLVLPPPCLLLTSDKILFMITKIVFTQILTLVLLTIARLRVCKY